MNGIVCKSLEPLPETQQNKALDYVLSSFPVCQEILWILHVFLDNNNNNNNKNTKNKMLNLVLLYVCLL